MARCKEKEWREHLKHCSHEQMEGLCVLVYKNRYPTKKVYHTLHLQQKKMPGIRDNSTMEILRKHKTKNQKLD
jgi:hypothetical protein